MPKAYSRDLRERVITAVETGASRREASERFEVSVASAVKWLQRWYQKRSAAPKPRGGSVSPLEEFAVEILDLIAQRPDLTLVETVQNCASDGSKPAAARSGVFSTDTTSLSKNVWRAPFASGFRRHGLTSLLQRIRSRDQFSRPRWRSAHPGPNKSRWRRYAIFLTRVPECRSTVRPSRFPPPASLRRSISA